MDRFEQRQLWAERIKDFRESDLTMKAWCEKTGHSMDQLKYWVQKYKTKPESTWLPVSVLGAESSSSETPPPAPPALTMQIQMGSIRIDVYPGAQPEMLRDVLHVLVSPC